MRARTVGLALAALGVVAVALSTWRSLARPGALGPALVGAAVVLLLLGAVLTVVLRWGLRRTRARHHALEARLADWSLHEVWADRTLRAELARGGRWVRRLRGGTRLTLGWSLQGVALWRGGDADPLVVVPWGGLGSVTAGRGAAASSPRPAVVLDTVDDARLVVVPCARVDGGLLPASEPDVAALVATIRAVRPA
ncbi:hypothetical protein [Cellulomonas alba]|uniref:Uncharacterized protein n=1 Tax=Cellulomonas alba TaxID=3053467 RepID=A0ABT7SG05_9CELL|nr:hypothetical protein [Cellulomonas alba]MDM7855110.1 hypothetical protein [Cellulomonas alba]